MIWKKKGQEIFGMSFGTIFSIILIIFILGVAFFAINHFIGLSRCANMGLYYEDLREEIGDAWSSSSGRYKDDFVSTIPKKGLLGTGIEYVCFGTLASAPSDESSRRIKEELVDEYLFDPQGKYNVFAYPPDKGCDAGLSAIELKCDGADCMTTKNSAGASQFFCKQVGDDGKVSLTISKQPTDYQVTVS